MSNGSGTVDRIASGQPTDAAAYATEGGSSAATGAGRTLRVHSPDSSTFLREVTSWPPF